MKAFAIVLSCGPDTPTVSPKTFRIEDRSEAAPWFSRSFVASPVFSLSASLMSGWSTPHLATIHT